MAAPLEKPRRILAPLAALLLPGGGHFVLGAILSALSWVFVDGLCSLGMVLGGLRSPKLFWIGLGAVLVMRLAAIIDLRRVRKDPPPLPSWLKVAACGLVLIVVGQLEARSLRATLIEAFKIPSGAMIPTLLVGDHLFADKRAHTPERGEVIVFRYPKEPDKDFAKRVVAVGGETIEVREGAPFIDGQPIPRRRAAGPCRYEELDAVRDVSDERPCEAWQETLGGHTYTVIQDPGAPPSTLAPQKIPPGHVFVMGDNRDNSHDSRHWGTVAPEYYKGRALFLWWSSGANGIRWDRVNQPVR